MQDYWKLLFIFFFVFIFALYFIESVYWEQFLHTEILLKITTQSSSKCWAQYDKVLNCSSLALQAQNSSINQVQSHVLINKELDKAITKSLYLLLFYIKRAVQYADFRRITWLVKYVKINIVVLTDLPAINPALVCEHICSYVLGSELSYILIRVMFHYNKVGVYWDRICLSLIWFLLSAWTKFEGGFSYSTK